MPVLVGTMAPSNLRYWGRGATVLLLIDVLTHVCIVPQSVLFMPYGCEADNS